MLDGENEDNNEEVKEWDKYETMFWYVFIYITL